MSKAINLPVDLPQLSQFRDLRDKLAEACSLLERADGFNASQSALALVFTLFQELAYQAEAGSPVGLLQKKAVGGIAERLTSFARGVEPGGFMAALLQSNWLTPQGEDYFCPRFKDMNLTLGEFSSQNTRGAFARAFAIKLQRVDGEAMQLGMNLLPKVLVDEQGQPLDETTSLRVTRIILLCDKALGLGERQSYSISEGLIQNALKVVRKFENPAIDAVLRKVTMKRKHPMFNGMRTDRLLEQFEKIAGEV
jgi:hypothetical protein